MKNNVFDFQLKDFENSKSIFFQKLKFDFFFDQKKIM